MAPLCRCLRILKILAFMPETILSVEPDLLRCVAQHHSCPHMQSANLYLLQFSLIRADSGYLCSSPTEAMIGRISASAPVLSIPATFSLDLKHNAPSLRRISCRIEQLQFSLG